MTLKSLVSAHVTPLRVSVLALVVAGIGVVRQRAVYVVAPLEASEYRALTEYQEQLRRELEDLRAMLKERSAVPSAPTPRPLEGASVQGRQKTEEAIAALGERVRQLESQAVRVLAEGQPPAPDRVALERDALEKYRQMVLDSSVPPADRVAALRMLRGYPKMDLRDGDVARAVADIVGSGEPTSVRADAARHIKGARHPQLAIALVRALATDQSREVREESAESLAPMRDEPGVRDALERAARDDVDWRVRNAAREALGSLDR